MRQATGKHAAVTARTTTRRLPKSKQHVVMIVTIYLWPGIAFSLGAYRLFASTVGGFAALTISVAEREMHGTFSRHWKLRIPCEVFIHIEVRAFHSTKAWSPSQGRRIRPVSQATHRSQIGRTTGQLILPSPYHSILLQRLHTTYLIQNRHILSFALPFLFFFAFTSPLPIPFTQTAAMVGIRDYDDLLEKEISKLIEQKQCVWQSSAYCKQNKRTNNINKIDNLPAKIDQEIL